MRIFIPTLGTKLRLLEPWVFRLKSDYRNSALRDLLGLIGMGLEPRIELPADTVLSVDRIYIRKGFPDYDSITFRMPFSPNPNLNKKGIRFFAPLADVNTMEADIV